MSEIARRPGAPNYPSMKDRPPTLAEALLELSRVTNSLHEIHAIVPGRLDVRAIVVGARSRLKKVRRYLEGE